MSTTQEAAAEVQELLAGRLGDKLIAAERHQTDTLCLKLDRSGVVTAARVLAQELGARFMITIGADLRPRGEGYGVTHLFSLDSRKLFVLLDCRVPEGDAHIDSITPFVPGANWAERECYDVLGVKPDGHPDPRRFLMADDWPEGVFPLRRDFLYNEQPASAPESRTVLLGPPPGSSVMPLGPFFPVLEEPAYFRLFVEGEKIVGCDYRGAYNHRGIEKLGDSLSTYNEIPYVAERICGICGFVHSSCYCQAAEKAAGIEVPPRGRYIRTIMLEVERVHSHLLWLGIAGHILGFDTVLMQVWRVREPIMWICEAISGNRKSYGMNTIGGLRRDLPKELIPKLEEALDTIEREVTAIRKAIADDTTLHARAKAVGLLTNEWARDVCVVGPTARASNVAIDARVDHPYAAYDEIPVRIATHGDGDTWARVLVRLEETFESIRIIREALRALPEGPVCARIEEEIPSGRVGVSVVEAPRGEAVHVVVTGGDNRPYRWRVRAPTYPNLQAVPAMIAERMIADVPIIIGSLDPCFSCTERVEAVDLRTNRVTVYSHDELLGMFRRNSRRRKSP